MIIDMVTKENKEEILKLLHNLKLNIIVYRSEDNTKYLIKVSSILEKSKVEIANHLIKKFNVRVYE